MKKFTRFASIASLAVGLAGCGIEALPVAENALTPTPRATTGEGSAPAIASAAPSSAPIWLPTTSKPTPPSSAPSTVPTSAELRYLWPTTLPKGMQLDGLEASATAEMFVINASAPGTQWSATITGGPSSRAVPPPVTGTQPVTVRGQQGIAFTTGAGYSLFWGENLQRYAIFSTLSLDDALALAEGLQPLDQSAWLEQLDEVIEAADSEDVSSTPPVAASPAPIEGAAHYLWPTMLPQNMVIKPLESVLSGDTFVISLQAPNPQWSAVITGSPTSTAIPLPTTGVPTVTIRGQQAIAFSTGAGYSLMWQEDGQQYAIVSTLSLDDAVALADGLQVVDQQAWQSNLNQVLDASK